MQFWGKDAFLIFSMLFALLFAFAVGVSTYNFGSLMRYQTPLVPFYFIAMVIPIEFQKAMAKRRQVQVDMAARQIEYGQPS